MSTTWSTSNLDSREDFEEVDLGLDFYTGVKNDGSEVLAQAELEEPGEVDIEEFLRQAYERVDVEADTYTVEVEINERNVVDEDGYHEDFRNYYLERCTMSSDEVENLLD